MQIIIFILQIFVDKFAYLCYITKCRKGYDAMQNRKESDYSNHVFYPEAVIYAIMRVKGFDRDTAENVRLIFFGFKDVNFFV